MPDVEANSLRDAIERLYVVFQRYRLEENPSGAPSVNEEDHAMIRSRSLRELTLHELHRYAFKAMTTWGTEDDFKHLLPRLLELLAQHGNDLNDVEVVLGKLSYARWLSWPGEEILAICSYMMALWQAVLYVNAAPLSADECLCSINRTGTDIEPYLACWNIAESKSAAAHFAEFVRWHTPHWRRKGVRARWNLAEGWWGESPVGAAQVKSWLLDSKRLDELETAFFRFADDGNMVGLLSDAFNHLGLIRSSAASDEKAE